MARTARIFAQIDVYYFEDDRVLEAGDAWPLHFAAILACKRNLTDGTLTRRQLERIAPESPPDIGAMIATLIEVGLFIDWGTSIEVRGWAKWNDSSDYIEAVSDGGKKGNHLRWHVRKNVIDPECELCRIAPESPPDRHPIATRVLDTDVDTDVDVDKSSPAPSARKPSSPSEPREFVELYRTYPRKMERKDALKAWTVVSKSADPATIIAGAVRYAADPNLPEKQFRPYPAKWLRAGGWDDGPLPSIHGTVAPPETVWRELDVPQWHRQPAS
jgi:hypothetical protein